MWQAAFGIMWYAANLIWTSIWFCPKSVVSSSGITKHAANLVWAPVWSAQISGKQHFHHVTAANPIWASVWSAQNQWQAALASCNMQQIPFGHQCGLLKSVASSIGIMLQQQIPYGHKYVLLENQWQAALASCSMQKFCMCSMVCSKSGHYLQTGSTAQYLD